MKRNPLLLALIAIVTLFTVSCKKGGKTGLLVPKDAGVVVYFNTGSLSSKLSWAEVKQSEWFKEMEREAANENEFAKKVLNDPSASGLDIDKGFCFFVAPKGRGSIASFQGHIKDQKAFEAMLKSNQGTSGTPTKSGDLNILELDGTSVLSWNSSRFVVVADAPMNGSYNNQRFSQDSLVLFSKNIHALKGKDLLDSDPKFADLISGKGDLQLWMNVESLYSNMNMGMMSMLKMSTLMEGNFSTATLSFDDGKINFDGKQYYGKELAKVFDKYTSKGVNDDLTSRLPSGDVLFAGAYSYPMGALVDMVKLIGADGVANVYLGQKGLTMDDISKAFKGEMAFAVSDVTSRLDTVTYEGYDGKVSSYTTTKTEPVYVFGASIDDQKAFDKIYNIFQEDINKVPSSVASVKAEKGWLVLSNTPQLTDGFYAAKNKPAYADKLKGHQFVMYFNAQHLMNIIQRDIKDSLGAKMLTVSKAVWNDAVANGDYKNSSATFHMEVNMVDQKTNSLKQLNKYADQLNAIRKEERAKMYQDVIIDSATVTEAPPKAFN